MYNDKSLLESVKLCDFSSSRAELRGRRGARFVLPAGSPGWNNHVCCCRLNPLPSNYPSSLVSASVSVYQKKIIIIMQFGGWHQLMHNFFFSLFCFVLLVFLVTVIQKCICLRRRSLCDTIPSQLPSPLKSVYLTLKQASLKHLCDAFGTKPHPPAGTGFRSERSSFARQRQSTPLGDSLAK